MARLQLLSALLAAAAAWGGKAPGPEWLAHPPSLGGASELTWVKRTRPYTLRETLAPAGAFGGLPFRTQPFLTLYDDAGSIASRFQGEVFATLKTGATGYETLRCNGTATSADVGAAKFSGGGVTQTPPNLI